ncbi:hypothetical protein [Desulfotomaculum copahuensis]|uniref:Uncharacterized protein n=1 Tax=Desulfotomaculum copahuensis TaxID=1838280 RepID=A0A1B7LDP1_9FIRM|nr:hypothetical protein [Desulfotomaculum copahuensis]OAT81228.1 hypothetical protein A6M21_00040 [Desulfotomaculum copahuensis]
MSYIVWKPIAERPRAYVFLGCEKQKNEKRSIYLGATPERAAARLRKLIGINDEYFHLVTELYRGRPGRKPQKSDQEKVIRSLLRLKARYKDEYVQSILEKALSDLGNNVAL